MSRLVVAALLGTLAAPLAAQEAGGPRFVVRFPVPEALEVRLWTGPAFPLGGYRPDPAAAADRWRRDAEAAVRAADVARRVGRLSLAPAPAPVVAEPPVPIPRPQDLAAPEPPLAAEYAGLADLNFDALAHLEMRFDRLRNARCTAVDVADPFSGCRDGFPTPTFAEQFRVRAGGVVSERLNVNVDFDSEREFSVNNDLSVWYQGMEGEVLRRVDVGNVTFRAPPSQFITTGIPSNSFGLQVEAQTGNLELRTVIAQQRGSAVRTRFFTIGETATQPVGFHSRELDFESGRFFFTVDPRLVPGYPAVDILSLDPLTVPATERPVELRVYRLRAQSGFGEENPNLGGIDAVALRRDSPQRVGPFSWETLVEGRDYYVDPSRLWFALTSKLTRDDFLAVSFVTATGDTVGTFPSLNSSGDTLELIHEPKRGPEVPTFAYEIRSAYRVGGSDVARSTIGLTILMNESEQPLSGSGTYLARLGMALTTDPANIDHANRVFPRERDPAGGDPVRDYFVVFPHLQPFADAQALARGERNDSLYRTPTYLLTTQGPPPRFALRLDYEATGAGNQSLLNLGAIQVRSESDRVFVGDRQLVRGVDYEIDYSIGLIQFLEPQSLFVGPTPVRVQFEENQLFDPARQNVIGLAGTYHLSRDARLHAVGFFQSDRSNFTRPTLGIEPQSGFIGGVSGEAQLAVPGLTGLVDKLPLIDTDVPSRFTINGEIAVSKPNPNRFGVAYLDDFEQRSSIPVSLLERRFQQSSAPSSGRGLPATHLSSAGTFDPGDAVPVVWQNVVLDANGNPLEFSPRDIDTTIVLTGTGIGSEAVLWLSLKPDTVGGAPNAVTGFPRWSVPHTPGPRWRSITQPLGGGSGVGADLSRVEFIEFWVLEDAQRTVNASSGIVVFDFGTTLEDAAAFAPLQFQVVGSDTVFSGRRAVGVGVLDTERDTLTNVYNAIDDDRGILGDRVDSILNLTNGQVVRDYSLCDLRGLAGLPVFPLGDLRAPCTRRNTRLDTEDLNGDNRLDVNVGVAQENLVRYVFPVGDQRYFVRDGVTTLDPRGRPATWRLYRIPFREDSLLVGTPNLRQIESMRLTFVAPDVGPSEPELTISLARFRLVGAPWIKRADTPILGLSGRDGVLRGEVAVSVVTTEDRQLGYESPPGITDAAERSEAAFELGVTQVNETSLRVLATDLRTGERAEVLTRFALEADRNFLQYRRLRAWARGRGPGWAEGDLEFFLKVGRDEDNFYLYRTPARTDSWEPEVVVDLDRWLRLRAAIETAWLAGEAPSGAQACGGDSTAYVACDGPYVVHVRDPGVSPPSLAQVSELAVGIYRAAEQVGVPTAELWVDDIRLTDVVADAGFAGSIDARLSAADFLDLTLVHSSRDANFRQLGEQTPFISSGATRLGATMRVDKLLPESWGLVVPVSVQHVRSSETPFYVQRTDLVAEEFSTIRRPSTRATVIDASLRRARRGSTTLEHVLVDPWSVRAQREVSSGVASFTSAETVNRRLYLQYDNRPDARSMSGAPKFLIDLVNGLPSWIRDSEFGKSLRSSRLRWNPYQIRWLSTLTNDRNDRLTFRVPVGLPGDSALTPLVSRRYTWRNELGLEVRPYSSLGVRVTWASLRDLQDYGDSTTTGRLLEAERRDVAGVDVGFERTRSLTTELSVTPVVSSWLRPRLQLTTSYLFVRDPNRRDVLTPADSITGFRLPETQSNGRRSEIGATFDMGRLVRGVAGDSGLIPRIASLLLPADVSFRRELRSSYDRARFDAPLGFRLGLGELGAFRFRDSLPATAAGEETTLFMSGGARLPANLQVLLSYRDRQYDAWSRRDVRQTEFNTQQREWPSLSVSWLWSPRSGLQSVFTNLSAGAQYRVVDNATVHTPFATSGATRVITENNTTLFSPTATVVWRIGLTTTVQYTVGSGEGITSGNLTESDRHDWGAAARFAFRLPESLVRMRDRVHTNLSYNSSDVAVCLLRVGATECRTVSDSRRRQFDVRMDTGLSEVVRGGMSFSYVLSEQRHTASSITQTVFAIFADITLMAGQIR